MSFWRACVSSDDLCGNTGLLFHRVGCHSLAAGLFFLNDNPDSPAAQAAGERSHEMKLFTLPEDGVG